MKFSISFVEINSRDSVTIISTTFGTILENMDQTGPVGLDTRWFDIEFNLPAFEPGVNIFDTII